MTDIAGIAAICFNCIHSMHKYTEEQIETNLIYFYFNELTHTLTISRHLGLYLKSFQVHYKATGFQFC